MRNKGAIKLIDWYKREISPGLSPRCRHIPTCSEYARGCYEKFNFFTASFYTAKRLIKCTPLFKPGHDPVPLTRKEKLEFKNKENKDEQ